MTEYIDYEKAKGLILQDKKIFEDFLETVKNADESLDKRIAYAQAALQLAVHGCTGYFYSPVLENFFTGIAQNYDIPAGNNVKQGTVLHILTMAYLNGGHTRVVERWIKLQKNFSHSVLLIAQGNDKIPEELIKNAEGSGGCLYVLEKKEKIIKKALKLRSIASEFQYVVLHTHMDDPVSVIAFGTEKFKRPVLLFNHADHMFWIGQSVADIVIDFRKNASISKTRRNLSCTFKLPIPSDFKYNVFKPFLFARRNLQLDEKKKIIITSGSSFKYRPFGKFQYFDVLDFILEKSDADLYVIGVGSKEKEWQELCGKYKNRLHLLGSMPYDEYVKWIPAANLIIDSYPMGGGTALNDAINAKVPFISLQNLIGQTDFVLSSAGSCRTKEEMKEKTLKILNDPKYADEVFNDELAKYRIDHSKENWLNYLEKIFSAVPARHSVKHISPVSGDINIDDYCIALYSLYRNFPKKKQFLFFKRLKYDRVREYYIFNHKLFTAVV